MFVLTTNIFVKLSFGTKKGFRFVCAIRVRLVLYLRKGYINIRFWTQFLLFVHFRLAVKMQKLLSFVHLDLGYVNGIEMVTTFREHVVRGQTFFFQYLYYFGKSWFFLVRHFPESWFGLSNYLSGSFINDNSKYRGFRLNVGKDLIWLFLVKWVVIFWDRKWDKLSLSKSIMHIVSGKVRFIESIR